MFTHGSFPEVGQKQKTEKKKKERERPNDGNNNGQIRIATPPWVAHAKPPGPKCGNLVKRLDRLDHSVRNESQNDLPAYLSLFIFGISPLKLKWLALIE